MPEFQFQMNQTYSNPLSLGIVSTSWASPPCWSNSCPGLQGFGRSEIFNVREANQRLRQRPTGSFCPAACSAIVAPVNVDGCVESEDVKRMGRALATRTLLVQSPRLLPSTAADVLQRVHCAKPLAHSLVRELPTR